MGVFCSGQRRGSHNKKSVTISANARAEAAEKAVEGPFTYDAPKNLGFVDPLPLVSLSHTLNLSTVACFRANPPILPHCGRHTCEQPRKRKESLESDADGRTDDV